MSLTSGGGGEDVEPDYSLEHYEGVDLSVKFAKEIAEYSDVWAWLKARLTARNISGLHVKDYIRWTSTDGKAVVSQIAGINQYLNFNDRTLSAYHIDFISQGPWPEAHAWNKVDYNNGLDSENRFPYLVCDLKRWLNAEAGAVPNEASVNPGTVNVDYTASGVLARLPAALKNVIVEKRAILSMRFSASSGLLTDDNGWNWASLGKLWVPSEMEVYGCSVWGTKGYSLGSFTQYPIFRDSKMRVRGRADWWLLTPRSGSSNSAALVGGGGIANYGNASNAGIRTMICFRIAG